MKMKIALLGLMLAGAAPALALDLQGAKAGGQVGETPSGYLGAVGADAEVGALVNRINAERRSRYQAIAAQNRIELSAVEQMAGKTAIEKTPPGQYVRLPSGQWVRKQ